MSKHLTLEQFENDFWPEIDFPSRLVESCHRYRKIPLSALSIEQLRLLLSQQIGLVYLVPLALDVLSKNILAEGDLYEGDLLASVVKLPLTFWQQYPELAQRFELLKVENEKVIKELSL